jgi:hypothetical protein
MEQVPTGLSDIKEFIYVTWWNTATNGLPNSVTSGTQRKKNIRMNKKHENDGYIFHKYENKNKLTIYQGEYKF